MNTNAWANVTGTSGRRPPPRRCNARGSREEIPGAALEQLKSWAAAADPIVDRLQQLAHERAELELIEPLLSAADGDLPNLQRFTQAGPILASRAYLLAAEPHNGKYRRP